jgi:hypothetical protein
LGLKGFIVPRSPHDVGPYSMRDPDARFLDPGYPINPVDDPWPLKDLEPEKPTLFHPSLPTPDLKKLWEKLRKPEPKPEIQKNSLPCDQVMM